MSKYLLKDLERQHRKLEWELFHQVSKVNFLSSPVAKELTLSSEEIFAKKQIFKTAISLLIIKKERLEFWMDLLNNKRGKNFEASSNSYYPIITTNIIDPN